jgi:hypothetical protein
MEQPMKRVILAVAAPFVAACATVDPPAPPYRALVIDLRAVDPDTGAGSFEVAPRELATVTDLDALDGAHLRMFRGGSIRVRQIGPTVVGSGLDHGDPPDLRYDVRDGTITAVDYSTLAMLSAYHAYERLFGELPRVLGLSIEQLDGEGAQFAAFFEPETIVETTVATVSSTARGNAFYVGNRRWGLAPPAQYERAPLVTDLRVLAHEFGHFVFERQFDAGHPAACAPDAAGNADARFPGRLDAEYAIDGLNEGFADLVSFAVTGGINPVADLALAIPERSLRSTFVWDDLTGDACRQGYYCIGTLFARSLFEAMPALGLAPTSPDDRGALSREVVAALAAVPDRLVAAHLPAPDDAVRACTRRDRFAGDYDGRVTGAFLEAIVAGLSPATRAALCPRLIANLGPQGFPAEDRAPCGI